MTRPDCQINWFLPENDAIEVQGKRSSLLQAKSVLFKPAKYNMEHFSQLLHTLLYCTNIYFQSM